MPPIAKLQPSDKRAGHPRTVKKVFVVENHPLMCRSIVEAIEREADLAVCGHADNADEALTGILSLQPDAVVKQLQFESTEAVEFIKCLRAQLPALPIIAIATFDLFRPERMARIAGANAFACKHDGPQKLIATIRAALRQGHEARS